VIQVVNQNIIASKVKSFWFLTNYNKILRGAALRQPANASICRKKLVFDKLEQNFTWRSAAPTS